MNQIYDRMLYVGGQWLSLAGILPRVSVKHPYSKKEVGTVPDCSVADYPQYSEAARLGFNVWSKMSAAERASMMRKLANKLIQGRFELGHLITQENGKVLKQSISEIEYSADFLLWSAEECERITGEVVQSGDDHSLKMVVKQPIGPIGLIVPWNFPLAMILRPMSAAWAAGCSVIVKPSEETPLSVIALAEIIHELGFPEGVFNVITCSRENAQDIGKAMCNDPNLAGISFIGSSVVGKRLYSQCAETMKRISMELGGNAPFVIFPSADLDKAVDDLMVAKFRYCGQTCISPNRIFVCESLHEKFIEKYRAAIERLKFGDPLIDGTNVGPVINTVAFERIRLLVDDCSKNPNITIHKPSNFKEFDRETNMVPPYIVTNVQPDDLIFRSEIFGPVTAVIRFRDNDEEKVINMCNQTPHGLASYFYSNDHRQMRRVASALRYGMCGVNSIAIAGKYTPFGGCKESGIGRESGRYGVEHYLEIKSVVIE